MLLAALVTALSEALWVLRLEFCGMFAWRPPSGVRHDDDCGVGSVAGVPLLETAGGCCTKEHRKCALDT